MKYINYFNNKADYDAWTSASGDTVKPNVAFVKSGGGVKFNPFKTSGETFTRKKIDCGYDGSIYSVRSVRGNSLVWNQLVSNLYLESDVYEGLTVTNNGDGTYTFNGTTTALFDHRVAVVNVLAGHKYFVRLDIPNAEANFAQSPFTLDANGLAITTPASDETRLYITINQGVTINNVRVIPQVIDLTLLGIDNLTTVEEVEAWLATNVGLRSYYPFNAGELKSNDAQSIVTVGRNQWDEEWETGYYDTITGEYVASGGWRCSVNPIKIVPNVNYYNTKDGSTFVVLFYDSEMRYIGYLSVGGNAEFSPLANATYMHFYCGDDTTYVCINISDASFNGQYEPYWKNTLELNIKTLTGKKDGQGASVTIFPDGAGGVGSVYDELRKSVAYKRFDIVDLGNLSWYGSNGDFYCYTLPLRQPATPDDVANIKTWKYVTVSYVTAGGSGDKIICGTYQGGTSWINIKDSSYSDAGTFTAAISGVKLIYEMATPETYVLDTPFAPTSRYDAGGTIERLPKDTPSSVTAPFSAGEIDYA